MQAQVNVTLDFGSLARNALVFAYVKTFKHGDCGETFGSLLFAHCLPRALKFNQS